MKFERNLPVTVQLTETLFTIFLGHNLKQFCFLVNDHIEALKFFPVASLSFFPISQKINEPFLKFHFAAAVSNIN